MKLLQDLAKHRVLLLVSCLTTMLLFVALGLWLNRVPLQLTGEVQLHQSYLVEKTNNRGMITEREVARGISRPEAVAHLRSELASKLTSVQFEVLSPSDGVLEVVVAAPSKAEAQNALSTLEAALTKELKSYEQQGDKFRYVATSDASPTDKNLWGVQFATGRLSLFVLVGIVAGALIGAAVSLVLEELTYDGRTAHAGEDLPC